MFMGQPGRPRKYETPEQQKAAAARRQAKHRAKVKEMTKLPPGAVVLTAEEVRAALELLDNSPVPLLFHMAENRNALIAKLSGSKD